MASNVDGLLRVVDLTHVVAFAARLYGWTVLALPASTDTDPMVFEVFDRAGAKRGVISFSAGEVMYAHDLSRAMALVSSKIAEFKSDLERAELALLRAYEDHKRSARSLCNEKEVRAAMVAGRQEIEAACGDAVSGSMAALIASRGIERAVERTMELVSNEQVVSIVVRASGGAADPIEVKRIFDAKMDWTLRVTEGG